MSSTETPVKIAVLGGYGSVGRQVCTLLASELPETVVVAGRDSAKSQELARTLDNGTTALIIDAFDLASYKQLFNPKNGIRTVISCLELSGSSTLPEEVLVHGINYTELSATYASHQRLMRLQEVDRNNNAAAIVGVGLMPGLSNVMAAHTAGQLDEVQSVAINLMLGLGEVHGLDAIKLTLKNIGKSYDITYYDGVRRHRSFTDPYKTTLIDESKPRTFYRFDFSDQHMLNATFKAAHVDSRMAFDSRAITKFLGGAARLGLLSLIKESAAPAFQKLFGTSSVGRSVYALQVEASGIKNGQAIKQVLLAQGEVESKATAYVAAYICTLLAGTHIPAGVHPIEQVVDPRDLYAYLSEKCYC